MNDQSQPKPDVFPGGASRSPGTDPTVLYNELGASDNSEPLIANLAELGMQAPRRLGKYELHGRIGSGGMGIVFKGFDPDLERMVAIKVLQPHLAQSEVARRRFQREARAAAAISHENVLTIHAVEEQDHFPFLVMEYVSGSSLKDYLSSRGKLTSLEIIRLSFQIARGLEAAHAQGVIHRDVKPGNVMLHDGGTRVRLMDFGLARVAYDNMDLTSHDQTVGTPAYMSPEQVRGDAVDARSDLFSLGCVIYCMATGQSPFHGGNHAETVHRILDFRPPHLQQVNPLIPPVVSEIVDHLLAKAPEDRYQSASEVADLLSHLVAVINQTATEELETVLGREVAAAPLAAPAVTESRTGLRSTAGRAATWITALFAIAVAIAFLALWWNRDRDAGFPTPPVAVPGKGSPRPRLAEVVVGRAPGATCSTLSEALERVAPSGVIRIPEAGVYEEAISLNGLESLTIRGGEGVVLRPVQPEMKESVVISIKDCRDILIDGLRLEATQKKGRTVTLQGQLSGIAFENCEFVHSGESSDLSLVSVKAIELPEQKPVRLSRSRFQRGAGIGYCMAVESREGRGIAVECEDCRFRSNNSLLYLGSGCGKVSLRRNLFLDGDTGIRLSFDPWTGSEQIDICNNTFSGIRYWLSWMDTTPGPDAAEGGQSARLANNLILGGTRTLGNDAQWATMLSTWTIHSNYWERDATTTATADRGGRLALMFQSLDIPNRSDEDAPTFLRPAAGSPLGTQGAGGDLPRFIGAREPLPDGESVSPALDSPAGSAGDTVN